MQHLTSKEETYAAKVERFTTCGLLAGSPDPNVNAVVSEMINRSVLGKQKYGCTTADNPLTVLQWLQHLQEELCDAVIYIEAAKKMLDTTAQK